MIGILLITHEALGEQLILCASHVVGFKPPQLMHLSVFPQDDPDEVLSTARTLIKQLDGGGGVLVLSDMFGATPCNIATRLVVPGKVEALAGVNLPMLVRILTYRSESLSVVIGKGLSGGQGGVVQITMEPNHAA